MSPGNELLSQNPLNVNIDMELLRTFVAISEASSFSAAGLRLNKTQSAVSQQMQRLENQLGLPLFEKSGRSKQLSPHGQKLLKHASQLLAMHDETVRSIYDNSLTGHLRIGAPYDVADSILPMLLSHIIKATPHIDVEIKIEHSAVLMEALHRGEIDMCISTREDDKLEGAILRTSPIVWFCSEHYNYDRRAPLPLILADGPSLFARYALAALVFAPKRVAVFAGLMLAFCLFSGLWVASMQTIALVLVAVLISVAVAFPLGVLAARFKRVDTALLPILNIMQTVPPWVYLIPAVMLFSLGRVPAIIATIVYGIPPMLRLTTLAFKQLPKDLLELGQASGASPRAILFKIELPTAAPTLLVGLNQCILLSLAMVVLAGLVGAGGLGAEVTRGLTRMEMGLGLRAGLAIVAVALLLDRLSRGALQRHSPRKMV